MTFLIVTHVQHYIADGKYYAYGPYVREMNLWFKYVSNVIIVAPLSHIQSPSEIDIPYEHNDIMFKEIPAIQFTSIKDGLYSVVKLIGIFNKVCEGMRESDHIHLRCPGNMGLVGCVAQVFFPTKNKTAKYAGNWDWNSKQPLSYRIQQRILRSTLLTKNMAALVYGNWPDKTKNIKPFFTATYSEKEKIPTSIRKLDSHTTIELIYVGSLTKNKNPFLSLQVCEELRKKGIKANIHFYGDGPERTAMEEYIAGIPIKEHVYFHGNVDSEAVKQAYQKSHFLVFISKSEGWPKVVAEAMFWGCLPITTDVSCVAEMIGYGSRGKLVTAEVQMIENSINYFLTNPQEYEKKCKEAMEWSRQYTLEYMEEEIKDLLVK